MRLYGYAIKRVCDQTGMRALARACGFAGPRAGIAAASRHGSDNMLKAKHIHKVNSYFYYI